MLSVVTELVGDAPGHASELSNALRGPAFAQRVIAPDPAIRGHFNITTLFCGSVPLRPGR
jgi:hypothetical protein